MVLAQVRFSPVLKMRDFVPEIQEGLRKRGFPGYEKRLTHEISFNSGQLEVENFDRWHFSSRDSRLAISLTQSFVLLASSRYDRFDDFINELERALEIVVSVSSPEISDRLGLRYIDLIRAGTEGRIDDYLQPGLRGLSSEDLGVESALVATAMRGQTALGALTVRLMQFDDGRFLPLDLSEDEIPLDLVGPPAGELVTVLDIDHASERNRPFEPAAITRDFWSLHDGTDRAFRAVVTPRALKIWGNSEIAGGG